MRIKYELAEGRSCGDCLTRCSYIKDRKVGSGMCQLCIHHQGGGYKDGDPRPWNEKTKWFVECSHEEETE